MTCEKNAYDAMGIFLLDDTDGTWLAICDGNRMELQTFTGFTGRCDALRYREIGTAVFMEYFVFRLDHQRGCAVFDWYNWLLGMLIVPVCIVHLSTFHKHDRFGGGTSATPPLYPTSNIGDHGNSPSGAYSQPNRERPTTEPDFIA